MAVKNLIRRGPMVLLALAAVSLMIPQNVAAGPTLEIEFSGLDLVYSGGQLCDTGSCVGGAGNPATAGQLASMDFFIGGVLVEQLSILDGDMLYADINLAFAPFADPGIPGTTTIPGSGGTFDLLVSDSDPGWGVQLDVGDWGVTYTAVNASTILFFGGGTATLLSQDLPIPGIGFDVTQPINWSFSSQLTGRTVMGGNVTAFNSEGTGEVRGPYVPEPGTLLFLGGALSGLALLRRRRR